MDVLMMTSHLLPVCGPILYVVHGGLDSGSAHGGEIGTIDLTTGTYTSLGIPMAGFGITELAWDGSDLWGVSNLDSSGDQFLMQ